MKKISVIAAGAALIAFVAGEDSGFITGHCVEVNGGLAMD